MDRDRDRLKEWMVRRRLQGCSVTEICAEAQISRDMFYRWWNRYQIDGQEGLREKAKGRPPGKRIDRSQRQRVIQLRKRYEWGPSKIVGYLTRRGCVIDHNHVYRIICDAGLNHPITAPRKTWGTTRFQRDPANSLWQADFKFCEDDYWMISFQDDHSRFITGSAKTWHPTGETAIRLLDTAVRRHGIPEQILTDQGTQFTPARGGVSAFDRHCCALGIEHITASVRRPTTIGMIEAFHNADVNEAHRFNYHWSFIRYSNDTRPHEALHYLTPAEIYLKEV